ncbi:MAG: GTPase HflX, partial [Stellaceae bacterium]
LDLSSGNPAILSDTVGFVSELPTTLVAAFRATLEEVSEADLIVHVRDVHHPDSEAQRDDVHRVLGEMGLGERVEEGLVEALNKIDLLPADARNALLNQTRRNDAAVPLSARTGQGCDRLLALLDGRLDGRASVRLDIKLSDGAALAWLYRHGTVVKRKDDEREAHLEVRLSPAELGRFQARNAGDETRRRQ